MHGKIRSFLFLSLSHLNIAHSPCVLRGIESYQFQSLIARMQNRMNEINENIRNVLESGERNEMEK